MNAAPTQVSAGHDLVDRALCHVLDHLEDGENDQTLAWNLGVSPRHLRRLFHEQLGITPGEFRRWARADLGRRLLQETDLTVTDVAFAAGFGSTRTFNRAFAELFAVPPLAYRQGGVSAAPPGPSLTLRLDSGRRPAWARTLRFFGARAVPGLESIAGSTYLRTVEIGGEAGAIALGPAVAGELLLRVFLPQWGGLMGVVRQARRLAGLDAQLETAFGRLANDEIMGPLIAASCAVRVPGSWDILEVGVRAILGDQLTRPGDGEAIARLVQRWGRPALGFQELGLTHLFPEPAALVQADLLSIGIPAAETSSIRAFAGAVASGAVRSDGGAGLIPLIAALTAIPGVDSGKAHYIALRLGEPDAFPWSEPGLRERIEAERKVSLAPHQVGQMSLAWRPWRAHAAALLALSGRADCEGDLSA